MSEYLATSEFDPSEPFAVTIELVRQLVAETRVDGAAVAVFATETTRNLVFASDEGAEELDDLQFTLGEGPGLDAYRFHRQELHDDLAGGQAHVRWPFFSAQALSVGAASFYAYPLAGGGTPFGVLELLRPLTGSAVPERRRDLPGIDPADRAGSVVRTKPAARGEVGGIIRRPVA